MSSRNQQDTASRRRWESAFEEAAIGMALVDLDGGWLEVNQAVARITGYPAEELLTMSFQEITHPEDLDADLSSLQALLAGEISSYEMEKRYIRKDGNLIWVLLTVTLVRDEDRKPSHFISQIQDISAKKSIESSLAERESSYRGLFEEAVDGIFLTDAEGRVISCNPAMEAMTGYSCEDVAGKTPLELVASEDAREKLQTAFQSGSVLRDLETHLRPREGDPIPVDISILPQHSDRGQLRGFQARVHDLTPHTLALRAQRRIQSIVDSSADAIMAGDRDARIIAWNDGATRMFGYTAEEAMGQSALIIAPPEKANEPRELAKRVSRGESVIGYETVRMNKAGERIDISMTMSPINDEEGKLVGFSVISRDIREKKKAEELIRRSSDNLRTIIDVQSDVASAGLNRTGIAQMIAARALALTRADGAGLIQVNDEQLELLAGTGVLGDLAKVRPAVAELALTCSNTGKTIYHADLLDETGSGLDGDTGGIRSIALVPLSDKGGTTAVLEVVSLKPNAFTDEELGLVEVMAGFMASSIRDANAFERQQQLLEEREAYAMELERSNVALQEFASIASHDLQEPLRKVRAFGDRLVSAHSEGLDDRGKDYLGRMQNAAHRMQSLIDALLNYSRVTSTARPFERVDLNEVITEVLGDLSFRIEQAGATVEVGDLPTMDADEVQMRQLFQNLIANATKFAREDVPPVVKVEGELKDGNVELRVADNGIGFEQHYADQIFRPFERLHGRSAYEGTGMGLAICRKIVERHGGRISARSTPGEGTTFIIRTPSTQWKGGTRDVV